MGGDDKQQGVFFVRVFLGEVRGGRIGGGGGVCSLRGPLLVLGRGCALVFGRGAEVLGRYVCSTRASSFLPFLIKFLEASLEFRLLLNWFSQVLTRRAEILQSGRFNSIFFLVIVGDRVRGQ